MEYCEKCGYIEPQCQCEEPMTNADRIRNMSDDELLEFLYGSMGCPIPIDCPSPELKCTDCLRNWLKAEVE